MYGLQRVVLTNCDKDRLDDRVVPVPSWCNPPGLHRGLHFTGFDLTPPFCVVFLRAPCCRLGCRKITSLEVKFRVMFLRIRYVGPPYMSSPPQQAWKKGSAELLVLSLLEDRPRHGYDIARLIDLRSSGSIRFHVASLYPLLYRLEKRDWIQGRWLEKANQRRRRYYSLTAKGKLALAEKRRQWQEFSGAIVRITGVEHA